MTRLDRRRLLAASGAAALAGTLPMERARPTPRLRKVFSTAEIRKVLPLAKELEVAISVENVWNHFLLSPLEAARYVDQFESPFVRWLGDGDVGWRAAMAALDEVGYSGWASAEVAGGGKERLADVAKRKERLFAL